MHNQNRKNMNSETKIDEIDVKIIKILLEDARTNMKTIAKNCGISYNTAIKRIERLKTTGVILGTTLTVKLETLGYKQSAGLGIITDASQESKIYNFIKEQPSVIHVVHSFGKFDLVVRMCGRNLKEIDTLVQNIKKLQGVQSVSLDVFIGEQQCFPENLDIQPTQA